MNIFAVDHNPVVAAQCLVDSHVVKMVLESAQLLSTAHRVLDGDDRKQLRDAREPVLYRATHVNHPSAIWCRQSLNSYCWLFYHFSALLEEYTHRYNKYHKTGILEPWLVEPPRNIPHIGTQKFSLAMDAKYIISDDPITNYRNYYKQGKTHLHKWTNRKPPEWMEIE